MPKSFEQMSENEREEWRSDLQRNGLNPGSAPYVDSSLESVYEFRPDLNATVERSPGGQRFIAVFRDGRLSRQEALPGERTSSRWALLWSIVWDLETVAMLAGLIAAAMF